MAFVLYVIGSTGQNKELDSSIWSYITQIIVPLNPDNRMFIRQIHTNQGTAEPVFDPWYHTITGNDSATIAMNAPVSTKALTVSGNLTATGNVTFNGDLAIGDIFYMSDDANKKQDIIHCYNDGDTANNYGTNLLITGHGNTIIGSGESPNGLRTNLPVKGGETMYITSDNSVIIYTNCNTIANKVKAATFTTTGNLAIKGTLQTNSADLAEIYTSDCKLEVGDIVCVSEKDGYDITKAMWRDNDRVFGIVSETPGLLINSPEDFDFGADELPEGLYPIARVGKVRAKVNGHCQKGAKLYIYDEGYLSTIQNGNFVCYANETKTTDDVELIEVII